MIYWINWKSQGLKMIEIQVYSNKQSTELKDVIGVYNIIRDSDVIDTRPVVFEGPMTVGATNLALLNIALSTINPGDEDEIVIKSNRNSLKSSFEVEDGEWKKKSYSSKFENARLHSIRKTIEESSMKFSTGGISNEDLEVFKKMLEIYRK